MADGLGEFDLIRRYLRPLAHDEAALSLADDAALIDVPENQHLVISKDMLIAGRHFFADDPPDLIAKKALRCNVSDLIAKGATPRYYSLGLAFPAPPSHAFMNAFSDGLAQDQRRYNWSLIGGDTTRSLTDFMVSVTAYGLCDAHQLVTRKGAKVGDLLYVSGNLGASALGLALRLTPEKFVDLNEADRDYFRQAYLLPDPPFGLQHAIQSYASASMDISDGLFADIKHLCHASSVSAMVDMAALPFCNVTQKCLDKIPSLLHCALQGGDDYQTLMTIDPLQEERFLSEGKKAGFQLSRIGEMTETGEELLSLKNLAAIKGAEKIDVEHLSGFTHF